MPNSTKKDFLEELSKRFGSLRKLDRTQSLYEIVDGGVRVYIRYSKVHQRKETLYGLGKDRKETFYGLRQEDLQAIEGHPAFICFLWNGQVEPLLVPFSDYEDVFQSVSPARDGQYKIQVLLNEDGTDLYIARVGRFNAEGYFGWDALHAANDLTSLGAAPQISHSQAQTLLGAIGIAKGHDVWVPLNDRVKLDWSVADPFDCRAELPYGFEASVGVLREVDVIWIHKGSNELRALFEVEHSTPIYSGLLRFNDIHLLAPNLRLRFSIVANDYRRSAFVRQLNRPTFRVSGLHEMCTFLKYVDVLGWHNRIRTAQASTHQD